MDNEKTYVEKVNDWLNADATSRTIEVGARLMLQGNRNRILYQNVIRKDNFEKVEYELNKIIEGQRVIAEPVDEEVKQMECNLPITMAGVESILEGEKKSKRPDHETLPAEIQSAFGKNLEIYPRMRSIQERLKVLNETGTAADRLPFLTELLVLDAELRTNWYAYDLFDANAPLIEVAKVDIVSGAGITAKQVSAARKYLSDNKDKLWKLREEAKLDKAEILLGKMQLRYDEITANGETFSPDQVEAFKTLGLIV